MRKETEARRKEAQKDMTRRNSQGVGVSAPPLAPNRVSFSNKQ